MKVGIYMATRQQAARAFVKTWSAKEGREDAERQSFWNDLLQRVYGIDNYYDYITYEKDVQVKADGKVTTRRIDGYIPSTKVMIEMKGKNIKDLSKPLIQSGGDELTPYEQAKRYANFLPQNEQPRWIVVSNFNEIDIHDMNHPLADPTVIKLEDLPTKFKSLEFLVDVHQQQVINEKQLSVDAGNLVAKIYDELANAYSKGADLKDPEVQKSLNMLIVRLVFLLYADDTGILGDEDMFQHFLERREPEDIRQGLLSLFKVLNQKENERDPFLGDEFKQFKYVNGGMFSKEDLMIPQFTSELKELIVNEAGRGFNWSNISPTIFGAVFESTLNPETRRSGGMHYTSIENIHKVIDPLFLNDLRNEFDKIQNMGNSKQRIERAREFQDKLAKLKFFDPACGSGNFLTETYLSLRKMENQCLQIIHGDQPVLGTEDLVKVKIQNFYGIEINDFAVSVARTALWIAENQMLEQTKDTVYYNKDFLPLDSNDSIHEGNALRMDWTEVVKPYDLDYIMGNPPFVALSNLPSEDKELKDQQKEDMQLAFSDLKKHGKLDYVSGWYEETAKYISDTSVKAAFVSTNSITQGEQVGILWHHLIEKHGIRIIFAYPTFLWSNEAKHEAYVFCVIIGFCSSKDTKTHPILFDNNGNGHIVKNINGYLVDSDNIYIESRKTKPFANLPELHKGSQPTDGGGLIFSEKQYQQFIEQYPNLQNLFKLYIGANELLTNKKRYCLWLDNVNPDLYSHNKVIKDRLLKVQQSRLKSSTPKIRDYYSKLPFLFTERRQPSSDYLAIPETTKGDREYIPITPLSKNVVASNKLYVLPTTSIWVFSILISSVHMAWTRLVSGKQGPSYSYSPAVYSNFPWPNQSNDSLEKLSKYGKQILKCRNDYKQSTLRALYDPLTMPIELREAHKANDKAVLKAYGLKSSATESEIVQHLFKMYEELAQNN